MSVRERGSGATGRWGRVARVLTAFLVVFLVSGWMVPATGLAIDDRGDEFEPNDTPADATRIDPGTYETPVLPPGDRDVYAVELDRGEELTATAEGGTLALRLLDPSGDPVAERVVSENGTVDATASNAGIYYVDVEATVNESVDYTLSVTVSDSGAGEASDATDNRRFEPNDGFEEAAPVEPGEYDGLRIDPTDRDVFAVELSAGERLRARIGFAHAEGDLDLAVYGPARLQQGSSVSTTDNEAVTVTAETDGTYYVEVYGYQGATAAYDLSLSTTAIERRVGPDRFEPNDEFVGATRIDGGEYTDPRIDAGESDYYAVELDRHDRLTAAIDFTHARGDLDLALYGPDRQERDASISTTDGEEVSITAERAGTYYLEVYGYRDATAPYDLSVDIRRVENDALEPNDRFETASAIVNQELPDTLRIVDGEDDYFAVPLQRGQQLTATATFEHDAGDLDLELYGPRGTRWAESYSVTDNETASLTAPVDGTYYVRVFGFEGAGAPYALGTSVTSSAHSENTSGATAEPPSSTTAHESAERPAVSPGDEQTISLATTSRVDPAGTVTVTYSVRNNDTGSRAVILQSGLEDVPWTLASHTDGNATWRPAERAWLFSEVGPGENVTTSVTLSLPANATSRHLQARAIATEQQATAPVTITIEPASVSAAVDRNGDGTVDTAELQAAVEWWDRGEPVPGSGGFVISDQQMRQLLGEWQSDTDDS